ncbi:MAG: RNA pyrophosphohydrolase [Candidatus Accumulibacter appositus]|uniref:RNA pyrophosphohydrolase n=1 Tax=Candidatus Accumulibacter appositus TaxID=1454003 RepID=A0A011NGD6_9PROT|nr:NUDIX domain-containing protein [Accumulibacter sp.]EXI81778.1 MAG: RNA pyrophosphohydrolase [Candidatus Accumulibacter appositus]HRF04153.1 NUDIX domain-containing protein [Accumulibacter sp.]
MPTVRRHSYGVVPTATDAQGKRIYLLLRAYANWDFPKGAADGDETPLEAAIRELREETGIARCELCWGEVSQDTAIYSGDKVATYFLARVARQELSLPISEELGRPEHDEYRWVSAEEAATLLGPRLRPILAWAVSVSGS